jgi:hypothetical protein
MKKFIAVCALAVLAVTAGAYACDKSQQASTTPVADQSGEVKEVALVGYLTDSYCGAGNANAKGKACAVECIKKGAKPQLYADKKLYTLEKVANVESYIGAEVKVTGSLDEATATITVNTIDVTKKS